MINSISRFMKSIATLAILASATSTFAGYTAIKPPPVGELGHEAILEQLYGGNFIASGNHFNNGSVSAYRVEDVWNAPGCMDLCGNGANSAADSMWKGKKFTANAVAKFSLNTQEFGMDYGSGFSKLFDVTGYGFAVSGGSNSLGANGNEFCFARNGDSGMQTSEASDNLDGRDHMITYCIEGLNGNESTWLMFWEDLNLSERISKKRSASDYNDLVIRVTAKPSPVSIPLPAAIYPGLALLAGTGLLKKFRRVA